MAPVVSVSTSSNNTAAGDAQTGAARRSSTGEDSENGRLTSLHAESSLAPHSEMSLHSYSSTDAPNESTPQVNKGKNAPHVTDTGNASQGKAVSRKIDSYGTDASVDMHILEEELVRMAPTIADLFKKIAKQTSSVPTSEEELQSVRDENERLRKTNKSLIEKLNTFQQKIIQLQLDNKHLNENGNTTRAKKEELNVKASELHELERRLDEHKRALEEKEQELNTQLLKLREIEEENEEHRQKIDKLEELQDEGTVCINSDISGCPPVVFFTDA